MMAFQPHTQTPGWEQGTNLPQQDLLLMRVKMNVTSPTVVLVQMGVLIWDVMLLEMKGSVVMVLHLSEVKLSTEYFSSTWKTDSTA